LSPTKAGSGNPLDRYVTGSLLSQGTCLASSKTIPKAYGFEDATQKELSLKVWQPQACPERSRRAQLGDGFLCHIWLNTHFAGMTQGISQFEYFKKMKNNY